MKRHTSRKRKRPSSGTRLRLVSMLATVTLLAGVIWYGSYLAVQPRVDALPPTIPFSYQDWMAYVPGSAQYVAYVDYRGVYEATGNYSFFGTDPLLEIYSPPFALYPNSVEYELAINLASQSSKEQLPTVSVIKVERNDLRSLDDTLSASATLHRTMHGQHVIFSLLIRRKELQPPLVAASLTIANGYMLVAQGPSSTDSVAQILDAADHEESQLFSESSARAALYAAGAADGHYLALIVATFPTQVEGAGIAVKTVSSISGTVYSRIAFSFESQDQARTHYDNVKRLYAGGSDYWILGPLVVVTFRHDLSMLRGQIGGL